MRLAISIGWIRMDSHAEVGADMTHSDKVLT